MVSAVELAAADIKTAPHSIRVAAKSKEATRRSAVLDTSPTAKRRFGDVRHINRGGGSSIAEVIVEVRKTIFDDTIIPWAKTHRKIVAEGIAISMVIAQFACYYGYLGAKGEGLYGYAKDNEDLIRARIAALGLQPEGMLRTTIAGFINSFRELPDRAKFAASVTFTISAFPVFVRFLVYLTKTLTIGYATAELLALVGILGSTPGKGALSWYNNEGGRNVLENFGCTLERARTLVRQNVFKRYEMQPLVQKYVGTVQKDQVLWIGTAIGSTASVMLGGEVTPQ